MDTKQTTFHWRKVLDSTDGFDDIYSVYSDEANQEAYVLHWFTVLAGLCAKNLVSDLSPEAQQHYINTYLG